MIIVGAKGFAKEIMEVFIQSGQYSGVAFFDNISSDLPEQLFGKYEVLKDEIEVRKFMNQNGTEFVLGVGSPIVRRRLYDLFLGLGGIPTNVISSDARIGKIETQIGRGVSIMSGSLISSSVNIKDGVLINFNCTVTHDNEIGDFAELSPGVVLAGRCRVSENAFIGTGSVLIPGVEIGANSIVAAGSVVTKSVPSNVLVAGVPAVIKKEIGQIC